MNLALKGLAAQQAGDLAECITLYRQSLTLDPKNPDVLHMLGVAHMQQFDQQESLAFIEQAADLTDWQIPAMRHNFGWALSVLMSARALASMDARAERVANARKKRASLPSFPRKKVAVFTLCQSRVQADALLMQLPLQSRQPVATIVLLPPRECAEQSRGDSIIILPSELPHSALTIGEALRAIDSDYVQFVGDAVTYTPSRLEQMTDALQNSGAQWGFSKVTLDDSEPHQAQDNAAPMLAELNGLDRLKHRLGENLRSLVRAAATTTLGASVSVADVDIDSGIRNSDSSVSSYMDGRMFRTRVICVNPDMLGEAFHHDGFGRYQDAYRVGFWFWELERLPRMWVEHAKLVDEIWVATDFVADAVRRDVSDRPVVKIRTPLITPMLDRTYSRTEFGLRDDCCLFMFSFAYGSFATRKNLHAVIVAFRRAFPLGTEHAQLVIKTSQSELFATARAKLMALASGDLRIVFINSYLSRKELIGLQSTIDCYLSLHRSEGLGLGLAECIALGKPAIATAYSGNLEFMNTENSFLVDFKLIPVREGEYPDFEGQMWADASVEHAATHMQTVYTDRARATYVGLAGKNYLAQNFNHQTVGQAILSRYAAIQQLR